MGEAPRIALVGANGYGISHRRVITPLQEGGVVELVGLCDLAPIQDESGAPIPPTAELFTDYRRMLSATSPDVVIVAAPPHTHLDVAVAAVRAGADVLLEKPPFLSLADHDSFTELLVETGRACQVGFQALGSAALDKLTAAIRHGRLGAIAGIGIFGAWDRRAKYYERAPWAGRRELDGRPILDGALANPFAHATMQALALAGAVGPTGVETVDLERFRAWPIEVDDTGVARLHLESGLTIVTAVTLCADERIDPIIIVHGDAGRAELAYTQDLLRLPGEPAMRAIPGRVGLLENLVAHRADPPAVPLLADVASTRPFTTFVEAIMAAPEPRTIDPEFWVGHGDGSERTITIPGVTDAMRRLADELALPSEIGLEWASS